MRTLIAGFGEIGESLRNVLHCYSPGILFDKTDSVTGTYEIMHVCFPYSKDFIKYVKKYQKKYKPKYTVIHSTVPVGTSRKCKAIHSPVIGIHPNMGESLQTFTKFLGGAQASEVANYFRRAGMKVHLEDTPEATELLKIQSTTLYALQIEFYKDMKKQCKKNKVDYNSWLLWLDNYNKGYEKLGYPEYKKPLLEPIMVKQGGHCTLPNLELLNTKFTKFLKEVTQ